MNKRRKLSHRRCPVNAGGLQRNVTAGVLLRRVPGGAVPDKLVGRSRVGSAAARIRPVIGPRSRSPRPASAQRDARSFIARASVLFLRHTYRKPRPPSLFRRALALPRAPGREIIARADVMKIPRLRPNRIAATVFCPLHLQTSHPRAPLLAVVVELRNRQATSHPIRGPIGIERTGKLRGTPLRCSCLSILWIRAGILRADKVRKGMNAITGDTLLNWLPRCFVFERAESLRRGNAMRIKRAYTVNVLKSNVRHTIFGLTNI